MMPMTQPRTVEKAVPGDRADESGTEVESDEQAPEGDHQSHCGDPLETKQSADNYRDDSTKNVHGRDRTPGGQGQF